MYRNLIKRLTDIVLAILALIILIPILIPIIIGLLLTGEHHVFYFQERIGLRNESFKIWKFATMLKNSPNLNGGLHTTRNDPRVLPMGKFLRKTKINEVPQLINILKGEMSFVGPRPVTLDHFEPYSKEVKDALFVTRPGLTGIGSIVFRDEELLLSKTKLSLNEYYNSTIAPYKGELELWYKQHVSFYTDLMILFITARVIFYPQSDLVHKVFKDLPSMPTNLKSH